MSIADICLTLKEPDKSKTVDDATAQRIMCLELDQRIERLKNLTLEQKVELQKWKAALM